MEMPISTLQHAGRARARSNRLLAAMVLSLELLFASPLLHAETLHQILREALLYDSQVESAGAARLLKTDSVTQERARLLPQISVKQERTRIENTAGSSNPKAYISQHAGLSLRQTLFNWGDWQSYQQSKLGEQMGEISYLRAEQALRLRVAIAYIGVLAAREDVILFEKRIQNLAELLHGVQRRFEEGRATLIDVSQAKADLTAARSEAVASAGMFDIALAEIGELVGHPVTLLAPLKLDLPAPDFSPSAMNRWLGKAEENDFEVQVRHIALHSSEREISKARAQFLPTAEVVGNYSTGKSIFAEGLEINNSDIRQRSKSVGITLSIPLFNGMGSMGRVSQARHLAQQARAELSTARHAAKLAASRAFISSRTGFAQLEAGRAAVDSTQFAFDAVSKGYAYGKKSLTDVSLAADKLFQANRNHARFQYDFHINYLKLMASAGELDESCILTLSAGTAPTGQRIN